MEKDKSFKSNFIWNILGTGLNAFNSLFFLMTVTRINGINEAGIFTLAFSTACILYVIGTYAGRVFQVTESKNNINDKEFIINRVISCILMMVTAIGYIIIKKYDYYKALIFILVALYKCIEAFSDVLYGIMQKNDLLNEVGKSYFIKSLLSIVLFIIVDLFTHSIVSSLVTIIIIWISILILFDCKNTKKLIDKDEKVKKKNIIKIFKSGFFIFAMTFLGLYLLNAQKYAIDTFLTEDKQTIFGIIVMPATVMALVAQVLLHPYLTEIVNLYETNNIKGLKRIVNRMLIYVIGFGLLAIACAYLLGIPVLNMIYGVDIGPYKMQLILILLSATLYNIGIIYSSVLTTIRKTFIQFILYIIASIVAMITADVLTKSEGIFGATISYFIAMFTFFISYVIVQNIEINKIKKIGETKNE